jgi:hypothetical protein
MTSGRGYKSIDPNAIRPSKGVVKDGPNLCSKPGVASIIAFSVNPAFQRLRFAEISSHWTGRAR